MLLLLFACQAPVAPSGAPTDDTGAPDTAAPDWVVLPNTCVAPDALAADPLTLEGQARVTQEGPSGFMEALDVELDGDLAYAVGQGGLIVFDISDPAAPERLYGPWQPDVGKLHRVERVGDGVIATSQREQGVSLWDVSDPAAAEVVGSILGAGMEGLAFVGDRLYVTVREEGVRVYDVSDPAAPVELGRAGGLEAPWELAATGDGWLYAADNTLGLVPIDVRDPDAPMVGEALAVEGSALHGRYADDRVWVATGGAGVVGVDVSDRAAPVVATSVTTGGSAVMTDVADGRLWVVDHEGLAVFDLTTDPPAPIQAERTEQFALAVDAEGDRAFVGDWNFLDVFRLDPGDAPALDVPSDTVRVSGGVGGVIITNRGSGTLTLTGATSEDTAVVIEASAATIAPGGTATLSLTGVTGDTTLCLASDDPDGPVRSLDVRSSAAAPAGEPAPDFVLEALDGTSHRLSEQLGAPVLLAYFATW